MSDNKKKLYLPQSRGASEAVLMPSVQNILDDALSIMSKELTQYRSKTEKGKHLELREARVVQGYIDSLVKLSRENREQNRSYGDLDKLSDEELLKLAETLMEKKNVKLVKEPTGS